MNKKVLIIQRFYYNFREGFFEYLFDINFDFKLINATSSLGRVKVHDDAKNKSFIENVLYFFVGENYVIFPFLFFNLLFINPRIVVTEGGQNTINNLQVLLYCKIFKRKYIIWDLGKAYAEFYNSFQRRIYMVFYKYILKQSVLIFGYNSQSKIYFKKLGINENKVIILHNTIDTRKIRKIKSDYISMVPHELDEQSKSEYIFMIYVGTLLKSKNIESMSELLKMLGKKYYLIIVGDGSSHYKAELEKTFEGTNHVFVGYKKLEQLMPYYQLASFSILPGLGGLSINQSMAFGVPVICSAADGAEMDLVIRDKTGYIYKDLPDAFNFIVSKTQEQWQEMGHKSESFLFSNHSVESMMNRFVHYTDMSC
jgi:glycosyltransferase involved in cell wall biosynthesis